MNLTCLSKMSVVVVAGVVAASTLAMEVSVSALRVSSDHVAAAISRPEGIQEKPGDTQPITIDGRRNPELIPEWSAWRFVFEFLQTTPLYDAKLHVADLGLTGTDAEAVLQEVGAHSVRKADFKRRASDLDATSKKEAVSSETLFKQGQTLELEFRNQILDSRDRLLKTLSPEGRRIMLNYAEERRANTTARIGKDGLEFYQLPRR